MTDAPKRKTINEHIADIVNDATCNAVYTAIKVEAIIRYINSEQTNTESKP